MSAPLWQGQSQGSSPPLPLAQGASGAAFCPVAEVPTGCCGGAVLSPVLWEVRFSVAECRTLCRGCRRQPRCWENQCLCEGQVSLA